MKPTQRTSASSASRTLLMIDKFPQTEKDMLIRFCPVMLSQIMLRDKMIRELQAKVKRLQPEPEQLELEAKQCL